MHNTSNYLEIQISQHWIKICLPIHNGYFIGNHNTLVFFFKNNMYCITIAIFLQDSKHSHCHIYVFPHDPIFAIRIFAANVGHSGLSIRLQIDVETKWILKLLFRCYQASFLCYHFYSIILCIQIRIFQGHFYYSY